MFTLNYSTLRALPYTSGSEFVFVQGYSSIGDGGEGIFFWDSSLTGVTDNDGTIILYNGTSTTGVWKRVYSGPINVKWFGISGTDNADAIQKAITATGKGVLYFPSGSYTITKPIILSNTNGITLTGDGMNSSIINFTPPDDGTPAQYVPNTFAFVYQTPPGVSAYEAPKFYKLMINITIAGYGGIRFNDATLPNGFLDTAGSQQGYIMRPYMEEVTVSGIKSTVAKPGVGIQWSKCFDGVINKCYITNFETGIDFEGSDLCTISNNRIAFSLIASILLTSHNTFGSQTLISHNDILSGRGGSYIISSDFNPKIEFNYFEQDSTTLIMDSVISFNIPPYNPIMPVLKTAASQIFITNNRVEASAASTPIWLDFRTITQVALLDVRNNYTRGTEMGTVSFPATGYATWYNNMKKTIVTHSGNSRQDGFPFNTQEKVPLPGNCVYFATPSTPDGITTNDYGLLLKCSNNEFIFEALSGYGSLITFNTGVVTGLMNVFICCYADTAGQVLNYQGRNNGVIITTGTITLTTIPTIYPLYSNLNVSNFSLLIWNRKNDPVPPSTDYTNTANVRIQKIYINQAI